MSLLAPSPPLLLLLLLLVVSRWRRRRWRLLPLEAGRGAALDEGGMGQAPSISSSVGRRGEKAAEEEGRVRVLLLAGRPYLLPGPLRDAALACVRVCGLRQG